VPENPLERREFLAAGIGAGLLLGVNDARAADAPTARLASG
jgi:hypothetical protein